jgi:hypothetical protein
MRNNEYVVEMLGDLLQFKTQVELGLQSLGKLLEGHPEFSPKADIFKAVSDHIVRLRQELAEAVAKIPKDGPAASEPAKSMAQTLQENFGKESK